MKNKLIFLQRIEVEFIPILINYVGYGYLNTVYIYLV